jgi:peroxiredoxin
VFLSLIVALLIPQGKPTKDGEAILRRIIGARDLPSARRGPELVDIAQNIGRLTAGEERVTLASLVVGSATEGDLGRNSLQAVADGLVDALRLSPAAPENGEPAYPYILLAQLERYEGIRVRLPAPELERALKSADETLSVRSKVDFGLSDLQGNKWQLSSLKGKVVLLNFWATWCPPCRKEMPDLQALYERFQSKGLVVLAVSDEDAAKVRAYAESSKWTFPVLLDPESTVSKLYRLESLPKSFVYDRDGKLVATGIDMRTKQQLLSMIAKAKLR